jgi:hypothetical protein
LDEVVDGLEEDDVRDEVEEDVCGDAADARADVEGARAAGRRVEWSEGGGDGAQFWEQVEEKEAGTEGVDAGERLEKLHETRSRTTGQQYTRPISTQHTVQARGLRGPVLEPILDVGVHVLAKSSSDPVTLPLSSVPP